MMLITINNGKTTVRLAAHEKRALVTIREMATTAGKHLGYDPDSLLSEVDELESVVLPKPIASGIARTDRTDETDQADD